MIKRHKFVLALVFIDVHHKFSQNTKENPTKWYGIVPIWKICFKSYQLTSPYTMTNRFLKSWRKGIWYIKTQQVIQSKWFRGLHFSGHSVSVLEFIATALPIKFPGPVSLFWNANHVSCLNIDLWQSSNIYSEFTVMDKHDNVSNYRRKWMSPRKFLAGVRVMRKENMFRPWPYKT